MKVTVDTNVLVRSVVRDDKKQAMAADRVLKSAELIAVPLPCLCEFVWVLLTVYEISRKDIVEAIRALLAVGNVEANRPAVEVGLAILDTGGDFADGVIAFEGSGLGGQTFVSFDRKAIKLLKAVGLAARLV